MKKMIKAEIYHDGEYYCAKCLDFDIFTQGKTLDEVTDNLKEAIKLHFEDDDRATSDPIWFKQYVCGLENFKRKILGLSFSRYK